MTDKSEREVSSKSHEKETNIQLIGSKHKCAASSMYSYPSVIYR